MNGQINLKNVGIAVGILICLYLIYMLHQNMSIESPEHAEDTVLTEVAKVPDFADNQINVKKLPTDQYMLYELFWTYTISNTVQYVCSHQVRYGQRCSYEVCLDEPYRPGKPCIVYSFGSQFLFDLEEDVLKHHQCEVHTYDPSSTMYNFRTVCILL